MAFFNTGNSTWDQGLNSLAQGLFPDPTKIAEAGYYGAKQREAQLSGNQMIDQMNANNIAAGLTSGSGVPPQQPRFMIPPGKYQPQGAPPILAPATNLPMVPGQTPNLGANTGQGQGQPPPVSTAFAAPGGAVSGGAPPPAPTMSPAALAGSVQTLSDGTPQVSSSPSPGSGAPSAPNTTASNATVPVGAPGEGTLHQGSTTSPDGGQKYAPPAGANGSPAPLAFNLNNYVYWMSRAGYNPDLVKTLGLSYIATAFKQGLIDRNTAERMEADLGATGNLTATTQVQTTGMTQAGETQRTAMTQAGETAREGMRLKQQESQFQRTPFQGVQGADEQGKPTVLFPTAPGGGPPPAPAAPGAPAAGSQPAPGGTPATGGGGGGSPPPAAPAAPAAITPAPLSASIPAFNQRVYEMEHDLTPVIVTKTGQTTWVNRGQLQSAPPGTYTPRVPKMDEPVTVYAQNPDGSINPNRTESVTYAEMIRDKRQQVPGSQEQVAGQIGGGVLATAPPSQPFTTTAQVAKGAMTPPPTLTPEQDAQRNQVIRLQEQAAYPGSAKMGMAGTARNLPVRFDGPAEQMIKERADQVFNSDPVLQRTGNYSGAVDRAIQQLQNDGFLNTPNEVEDLRQRTASTIAGNPNVYTETDAKGGQSHYLQLHLKKQPPLSQTITGTNTPPAGAIGIAPAGAQDGTILNRNGQQGVVRGGYIFPVTGQGGGG